MHSNMESLKGSVKRADFRLDEWVVIPERNQISRGRMVVRLRPRVMEVLLVLSESSGEVVSKNEFVDAVWPGGFVADNTVTHAVQELRAAFGDDAAAPRYVETVHRRGYRLIPAAEEIPGAMGRSLLDGARFVLRGDHREVFLADGENIIGRAGEVHVLVDSAKVSRCHAQILVTKNGATIEDLGSKNGTYVGSTRIEGRTPLADGDVISIGGIRFEICSRGGEDAPTQTLDA
jgi:DNA-binding winged helix-turn-helix (wHTH) protein